MGEIVITFTDIAAHGLPDADYQDGEGSSDPFVVFDIRIADGSFTARTPTALNSRNVQWPEDVRIVLPGPLNLSDVHGARLLISVWDDDDEALGDEDDPMGRREERLDSNGQRVSRRTLTGVGKLYSFEISFAYSVVSTVLSQGTRARALSWAPAEKAEAQNLKFSADQQTVTRLPYRGAANGTSIAVVSLMLSGQQTASLSFRLTHPEGGRGVFIGVGAATSATALPGRVVFLSVYSGRCFTGKSCDFPSRMLSGQLDPKSCNELARQLDIGPTIIRMKVDMGSRKLFFSVAEQNTGWMDSGASLPSSLRPCILLGDIEGATLTLIERVIFTSKLHSSAALQEKSPGPAESYWAKLREER